MFRTNYTWPPSGGVKERTYVDLNNVKRISPDTDNYPPLPDHKHQERRGYLDLSDKPLPPQFCQEFFGSLDVTTLSSTYRAVFGCLMTKKHVVSSVMQPFPGCCLIFNDDLFCVFNYNYSLETRRFKKNACASYRNTSGELSVHDRSPRFLWTSTLVQ